MGLGRGQGFKTFLISKLVLVQSKHAAIFELYLPISSKLVQVITPDKHMCNHNCNSQEGKRSNLVPPISGCGFAINIILNTSHKQNYESAEAVEY